MDHLTIFRSRIREILRANAISHCRRLCLVEGEESWGVSLWKNVLEHFRTSYDCLSIMGSASDKQINSIPVNNVADYLGQEFDLIFYNCHEGLRPDTFCQIAGTIRGGGLLICAVGKLASWQNSDRGFFLPYLANNLLANNSIWRYQQSHTLNPLPLPMSPAKPPSLPSSCQNKVIAAMLHMAFGHRNRPVIVIAPRGRGKSAALGLACATILKKNPNKQIILTAPSQYSCLKVQQLFQAEFTSFHCESRLPFCLPKDLLNSNAKADIVIIDEAANIAPNVLQKLVIKYKRVALATTTDGYEGTGQGFQLKFRDKLHKHNIRPTEITLNEPIRWCQHDPLESLVYEVFLQRIELDPHLKQKALITPRIRHVTQIDLLQDKKLLMSIYQLFISAHYRTTPRLLQFLLDNPNTHLIVIQDDEDQVIAAADCIPEGNFSRHMSDLVLRGKRRLPGSLVAQGLTQYTLCPSAVQLKSLRVHRIAVDIRYQRQGLGSKLVQAIITYAEQNFIDYVSSSFSANENNILFWLKNQFKFTRLSLTCNTSSGEHSATFLYPISSAAQTLLSECQAYGQDQFQFWLAGPLKDLSPQVVTLLWQNPIEAEHLFSKDKLCFELFSAGECGYEVAQPALHRLLLGCLAKGRANDGTQYDLQPVLGPVDILTSNNSQPIENRTFSNLSTESINAANRSTHVGLDKGSNMGLNSKYQQALIKSLIQKKTLQSICHESNWVNQKTLINKLRVYIRKIVCL